MNPTLTIILVLVIGIVVGIGALRVNRPNWLTRQIAGGRRAELTSALVGIAGAFIGGWIFHEAKWKTPFEGLAGTIFIAFVGAVVLLVALHMVYRYRRPG